MNRSETLSWFNCLADDELKRVFEFGEKVVGQRKYRAREFVKEDSVRQLLESKKRPTEKDFIALAHELKEQGIYTKWSNDYLITYRLKNIADYLRREKKLKIKK